LGRKREKRTSNMKWKCTTGEDARIAKMKDGRAQLAYKAEHAVDMESGAVVAPSPCGEPIWAIRRPSRKPWPRRL